MRLLTKTGLWLLFAIAFIAGSARAEVILNDPGGKIIQYISHFLVTNESGDMVAIEGDCLSACTLVLGLVPRNRICVTSKARLGFHNAWMPGPDGLPNYNKEGTDLLWKLYPENIRRWLVKKQGGLKEKLIYLEGKELAHMYRPCYRLPTGTFAQAPSPFSFSLSPAPRSGASP